MSNFHFNQALLGGRIVKDPELCQTAGGVPVVRFTLAVNRHGSGGENGTAESEFILCVAFRKTAEFIAGYFRSGSAIFLIGEIRTRSWQEQSGAKRYVTEVLVNEARFVDSKWETEAVAQSGIVMPELSDEGLPF